MSREDMLAMVRRNLSNDLPGAFPRPAFEPYLFPITGPSPGVPGSAPIGTPMTCHAPADRAGYVMPKMPDRRRRGGVKG